jgi:hypothetical protein
LAGLGNVGRRDTQFSAGASMYKNAANQPPTSFSDLADRMLNTRHIREDKDGEFISGAVLKDDTPAEEGKNFITANVTYVGRLLNFDLDGKEGGLTLEQLRARIVQAGVAAHI